RPAAQTRMPVKDVLSHLLCQHGLREALGVSWQLAAQLCEAKRTIIERFTQQSGDVYGHRPVPKTVLLAAIFRVLVKHIRRHLTTQGLRQLFETALAELRGQLRADLGQRKRLGT